MTKYPKDTTFAVVEGLEANQVPDGCVIYNSDAERVHFLNPTAFIVYELCAAGANLEAIENFVGAAYSLPTVPTADVENCIEQLVIEGLVRPCA